MTMLDDLEKVKAFDSLSELYYRKNFGSTSKADIDLLFFKIYIENLMEKGSPHDDYTLSKALGITETRVRSLKEKYYVRYMDDFPWKQVFASSIKNAKYDDKNKTIKVIIEEVAVLKELRHFIYEHGWYDEFQFNPKLFQCQLECFLMICAYLDNEKLLDTQVKELINVLKNKEINEETIIAMKTGNYKKGFKELVYDLSESALCELLEMLPFGSIGSNVLKNVSNIIRNKLF